MIDNLQNFDWNYDAIRAVAVVIAVITLTKLLWDRKQIMEDATSKLLNLYWGVVMAVAVLGEVPLEAILRDRDPTFALYFEFLALAYLCTGSFLGKPTDFLKHRRESHSGYESGSTEH